MSSLQLLEGKSFGPIQDLGAPDALIQIAGVSINLLPVLMTLINIISAAIYMKGFPLKSKIQMYGMALIFLILLYGSPSGLVLYWTMNNVFSLVKNVFYKLKNPAKTLYLCAAACCAAGSVFILFIYQTKLANKIIAMAFFIMIFAIPL